MLLSFIIPVFNIEAYLPSCIDSILKQITSDSDVEIILVDDGSTDKTGIICDNYAQHHNCITVVHQKNSGVSRARNIGLSLAKGDYVLFIDGDDILLPNALFDITTILKREHLPDILIGRALVFSDFKTISVPKAISPETCKAINTLTSFDALSYLYKQCLFLPVMWSNIFRRMLLIQNNIQFREGMVCNEDIDCALELFCVAKTFAILPLPHYGYRKNREGSATYSQSLKKIQDTNFLVNKWLDRSKGIKHFEFRKYLNDYMLYQYSIAMGSIFLCPKNEQKAAYNLLISKQNFLRQGISHKTKVVGIVEKIFGFRITAHLLSFYIKFHNRKL